GQVPGHDVEARPLDAQCAALDDLDARETLAQVRRETAIALDRHDVSRPLGQQASEDAEPRADFQDRIGRTDPGVVHMPQGHAGVDQEMLTQALPRADSEPVEYAA